MNAVALPADLASRGSDLAEQRAAGGMQRARP
jgi:hypothetical protein